MSLGIETSASKQDRTNGTKIFTPSGPKIEFSARFFARIHRTYTRERGGGEEIVRTKIVINFAISRTRRFLFIRRTRGRIRNENWAGDFDIVVEAYRYENVSPKLSTVFRANLERA